MSNAKPVIVVLGPTASGKTKLAAQLAYQLIGSVISADSRQVYKHLNIGTGKDYQEYNVNNKNIPYYLIDVVEPTQNFDLTHYLTACIDLLNHLNQIPIICGGTGLYIQALLQQFQFAFVPVNKELRATLASFSMVKLKAIFNELPTNNFTSKADTSTVKRLIRAIEISDYLIKNPNVKLPQMPTLQPLVFGLNPPLIDRRKKIADRLFNRIENGLIEEAEQLLKMGVTHEKLMHFGLEYKFLSLYLQGKLTKDELITQLTIAIQQYAKRQMTYFRKMEQDGIKINWINHELNFNEKVDYCTQTIKQKWNI